MLDVSYIAGSGISANNDDLGGISNNIANVATPAFKPLLVNTITGVGGQGAVPQASQTLNIQGPVSPNIKQTAFALEGQGMLPVASFFDSDAQVNAETFYTRGGMFEQSNFGHFTLSNQFALLGQKFNQGSGEFDSNLSPVFIDVHSISEAQTTTEIDAAELHLDPGQLVFDSDVAPLFAISDPAGMTPDGKNQIDILNDTNGNSCLGGVVTYTSLRSTAGQQPQITRYDLLYGGFVQGTSVDSSRTSFTDGTNLVVTVTANGAQKNVTLDLNSSMTVKDAISALQTSINALPGVNLSYYQGGGTLGSNNIVTAIGPTNPNASFSLSFSGTAVSELSALGFTSLNYAISANTSPQIMRFSSLANLYSQFKDVVPTAQVSNDGNYMFFQTGPNISSAQFFPTPTQGSGIQPSVSLMSALGLAMDGSNQSFIQPIYNPANPTQNLANLNISPTGPNALRPALTKAVEIYDSLGQTHLLYLGFLKTAPNTYVIEAYADPSASSATTSRNGALNMPYAASVLTFDNNGNARSISTLPPVISSSVQTVSDPLNTSMLAGKTLSLTISTPSGTTITSDYNSITSLADLVSQINNDQSINGFAAASISVNGGVYGLAINGTASVTSISASGSAADLLSINTTSISLPSIDQQFEIDWTPPNQAANSILTVQNLDVAKEVANVEVAMFTQNGYGAGSYTGFDIDVNGMVYANYSNDQSVLAFYVPIAQFNNIDGLAPSDLGYNTYAKTRFSGQPFYAEPGSQQNAKFMTYSLEESNTNLIGELQNVVSTVQNITANASTLHQTNSTIQFIIQHLF